jgi:L-threonylcarbamoyladenylate synthase
MMEVHYAPSTPAMLCSLEQLPDRIRRLQTSGKKCGLLTCQLEIAETSQLYVLRLPQHAEGYTQRFYAALRELDSLQLDLILVEQPLQTEPWQAINDRLRKATIACGHSM